MRALDEAVLTRIADAVCTPERAVALCRALHLPTKDAAKLLDAWRTLVLSDAKVGTSYARHLTERIVVNDHHLAIEAASRHAQRENAPP